MKLLLRLFLIAALIGQACPSGAATIPQKGGGPVSCDPAGARVVKAITITPSSSRRALICILVKRLEASGVWARLDALYITAAANAQAAKLNWIAPGTNDLSAANSPTFTADRGFAGDGATSYLAGINPASATNFVQNSASLSVYSLTSATMSASIAGWTDGAVSGATIIPRSSTNNYSARINNSGAAQTTVANPLSDGRGWYSADRSGAAALVLYQNGVQVTTDTVASAAVANNSLNIDHPSTASFSSTLVAAMAVGGHLTASQQAAFYSAIMGYLAPIGASI